MLSEETKYLELGAEYVNTLGEQKRKSYLKKKLEKLGYDVQLVKSTY